MAVVTHALRTPLAVVRAYVELLGGAARGAGSADAEGWEREALTQVDRLDETVDSILESLRVMPEAPTELVPIDLAAEVDAVLARAAADAARARPSGLVPRRAAGGPGFDRDAASAAGLPARERLQVRTHQRRLSTSTAGATATAPMLAVTDDGPGIPEAWRERIFEPFVRLDDSPRGAGIGLFAARRLARSMDGELTVEPREPHGSQFVLRLRFVGSAR